MKGKCPAMSCSEHLLRGLEDLLDLGVLANPLEHLVRPGFHADQQPAQAGLLASRPDFVGHANALVGAHGCRPGDLHTGLDDPVGERLHAVTLGEKSLVLEVDVIEVVAIPQLLQPRRHPHRLQPHPLAAIDERVGTERTTEVAALRGDVVELALALELEVAFDRNQAIVMRPKFVDLRQRSCRILENGAIGSRTVQPAQPSSERPSDSRLTISANVSSPCPRTETSTEGSRGIRERTSTGANPPHDRHIGPGPFGGARYPQSIRDRRSCQHGDSQTHRRSHLRGNCLFRIRVESPVDRDDLVDIRIELGADGEQRERHGEKYRLRVVEHDLEAGALGRTPARGAARPHGPDLPRPTSSIMTAPCRRRPELENRQFSLTKRRSADTRWQRPSRRNRPGRPARRRRWTAAPARIRRV